MKLLDYEREHLACIRKGLSECMVLLKKNGAFPLDKATTLAAYGNGVRNTIKGGTGSGEVNSRFCINIEQGLKDAGFTLTTEKWLDSYEQKRREAQKAYRKQIKNQAKAAGMNLLLYAMGATMPEPDYDLPLEYEADAAIYVLSRISGEGSDRKAVAGDVLLTKTEIRDILALNQRYEKFMLIVNTGGPVDLLPVCSVGNILVLSQLGVEMGSALADVLLGKTYPSGKLTTTWSAWKDYCPDIEFGEKDDTRYREGIYVGYRYFDTVGKRALFPFGYGLSYTDFTLDNTETSVEGTKVNVQTTVTNTGNYVGKEVVQVYITVPEKKLKKPFQELVGFAKTKELKPGESHTVTVTFDMTDIASFDEKEHVYCLENGKYILRTGTNSADSTPVAVITLDQDVIVKKVRAITGTPDFQDCMYERSPRKENVTELPVYPIAAEKFTTTETIYDIEPEVAPEVSQLSDEELVYLLVGSFSKKGGITSVIGNAATHVAGAAGESTSELEEKGFRPIIMADGPAGLRLTKEYYEDEKGLHPVSNASAPAGIFDMLSGPTKFILKLVMGSKKTPRNAKIKSQYCTAIPIGTAIAQSWNLEYAKTCGDIVGSEMERFGVHLWLAPALNIHRSILCGRNFEYFSEDPLISGKFAAALTKGVQAHKGRGTTIKHYAANNQEFNRCNNNSQMSERTLREIYLRGFGICAREAQPCAVMTSYNLINGVHTSEIRGLTEDYLRMENGYQGMVMTDWVVAMLSAKNSKYRNALSHHVAAAGGDIFMPGCSQDYNNIINALKTGELSRHQLEVNATRVYQMSRKLVQ